MAEVSGRALLGLIKVIKAEFGPDSLRDLLKGADAEMAKVFGRSIMILNWYPYPVYVYLLTAIDRKMGKGDLAYCKKLGENAASLDLHSMLTAFNARGGQRDLIKSCTMVWSNYYRGAGRMEALSCEPDNTVLRITDFPEMDPAHCRLMEGWMTEAMKMIGTRVLTGLTEVKCMSKGGPYHEFICTWTLLNPK